MAQRRYDLDWLRVIAFALLILFHAGMLFCTWSWCVKNQETSTAFDLVMGFVHNWRMPLLFFISGSAVWFALERYTAGQFFREREKRLLLPLLFGMVVIIPPETYVTRLFQQQHFDSFLQFYPTVFTSGVYPSGNLTWSHLWYIPYIWTYSLLLLPPFLWLRSLSGRVVLAWFVARLKSPWGWLFLFLPSALAEVLLRPYWPRDRCTLLADWANFTHKLTFFAAGFTLASAPAVYDVIAARRRYFLTAGLVTVAVSNANWPGVPPFAYHALRNLHVWLMLLAILGYGRRYLSVNHPFLKYANEAVYPFYILHQPVIVILGYQLHYAHWNLYLKYLVVLAGTFFITWAIYAWLIRPWNPLRMLFGLKRIAASTSGSGHTGASATTQSPVLGDTQARPLALP